MRRILLFLLLLTAFCLPKGWSQQLPLGPNLVVNGDFESGNTGFQTDYTYNANNYGLNTHGRYCIDAATGKHYSNDNSWFGSGHSGKFMMVNGSGVASDVVWQKTIGVKQNTQYKLSIWVAHLNSSVSNNHKAKLNFYINGVKLNNSPFVNGISSASQRPNWQEFTIDWNSGNATSAIITIYDVSDNQDNGNDFGLDDISFREYLVMDPISRIAPVCAGSSLTLTPPTLHCGGCTGRWEIFHGSNTVVASYTTNTIPNVKIQWNGYSLRYAVYYQGSWHYSNAVPIYVTENFNVEIQDVANNGAICDDDTITLHAEVINDVMDFDFIRVGDILCTDGSIVHRPASASAWNASGKIAKGIVFYVDSTDVHGWALGLSEQDYIKWSSSSSNSISGLSNIAQIRNAIKDFDGKGNTNKIKSASAGNQTKYPAAWYCDSEGGYLPAIGQLNVLFGGLAKVNASISLVGGVPLATTEKGWFLLSSTPMANDKVYYIDRSGCVQSGNKDYTGSTYGSVPSVRIARAVFDF